MLIHMRLVECAQMQKLFWSFFDIFAHISNKYYKLHLELYLIWKNENWKMPNLNEMKIKLPKLNLKIHRHQQFLVKCDVNPQLHPC